MTRGSPIMSSGLYISHRLSANADWRIIGWSKLDLVSFDLRELYSGPAGD